MKTYVTIWAALMALLGLTWGIARLNGKATDIRLRIPEAFAIHQRIIDWDRNFSPTGIPAGAVGLDGMTLRIMKWAMREWSRTKRLNRIAGTSAFQKESLRIPCPFHKFSRPSIQGDGWQKRIIRFSDHDSSITPIYRQPPSLTGSCWLLLLGTERKLLRRRTGTAWQPSP